jgi:hypothetical protein
VVGCDAAAGESDALPSALWEKIPGLDPCCSDRIAREPDKVIPPIKWEACTNGTCERAVGSTKPGSGGAYRLYTEPLRYSDGVHYLSYVLHEETLGLVRIVPVVETFGPSPKRLMVMAWDARAGARCGVGPFFGPGGSILTSRAFAGRAGYLGLLPAARYGASDIQVLTLPTYSGESPSAPAVSQKAAFFDISAGPNISASLNLSTRLFTLQPPPGTASFISYGDGAIGTRAGDGTFFPLRLGYVGPDGAAAPLLQASPGRYVFGYAVDRKQGDALVWLEAADLGGFGGPVDMWTAPFALPPAAIQRRRVMYDAQSPGGLGVYILAFDGYALFVRNRDQARLVRLSDGLGWILTPDTGTDFASPVGITEDYVVLNTAVRFPTFPVGRGDSLIRYRRSDLGPPTESNGL